MKYHLREIALFTIAFVATPSITTLAKDYSQSENITGDYSEKTINSNLIANNFESNSYTGIVKEIDDIATKITVRIATNDNPNYATGVIIANREDAYYLVTANYAVKEQQNYRIITSDGEIHQIDNQNIQLFENSNFAIIFFQSDNKYEVASIADRQQNQQWVFASGFINKESQTSDRLLTAGTLFTQEEAYLVTKDSYSLATITEPLVYTNDSYMGMGGGAILDSQGRLIGIQMGNEAEVYIDDKNSFRSYNLGYSLGTSIQNLLTQIKNNQTELQIDWLTIANNPATQLNSSEIATVQQQLQVPNILASNNDLIAYLNYGNQLWRYKQYPEAIEALKKAIEIKPDFDKTYYILGMVYLDSQEYKEAVGVLEKAVELNSKPYYYWRRLGQAYDKLEQYNLALAAYDKAIDNYANKISDDSLLLRERQEIADKLVSKIVH